MHKVFILKIVPTMGLLYNYTYLNANGYLEKFRNALGYPSLDCAKLTQILKIYGKRHKYADFIVDNGDGVKCLYHKGILNDILGVDEVGMPTMTPGRNPHLLELKQILFQVNNPKPVSGGQDEWPEDEPPAETDMQKVSDMLIYNDNYGREEMDESAKKRKPIKNDEGKIVPEKCDKCGGDVVVQIHGEPVYICRKCGKYFGTMPCSINETKGKKIYITESQFSALKKRINEMYFVEPEKVGIVKKYLDDNFERGMLPIVGEDGYPSAMGVVGMKGVDGKIIKNMTAQQLFYLLQDKFSKIYSDSKQRDSFLKKIIQDWYYKRIKNSLLSRNNY